MKAGKTEDVAAKRRSEAVEWLNSLCLDSNIPVKFSDDELRARLLDGTVLVCILNRISPGLVENLGNSSSSCSSEWATYFKSFILVMEEIGLPTFSIVDLQRGPMSSVVDCLLSLRDYLNYEATKNSTHERIKSLSQILRRWKLSGDYSVASEVAKANCVQDGQDSAFLRKESTQSRSYSESMLLHNLSSVSAAALINHPGHSFQECSHAKEGKFGLCATKISELTKSNNLDNAPAKSLFRLIHGILDECIENNNEEIHQPVACMFKTVLQELERRHSTQTEHIRNLNNLIKSREEKYQTRIKVLETLVNGTTEETKIIMDQFQLTKTEKSNIEAQKNLAEKYVTKLIEDKEILESLISNQKQELKTRSEIFEQHWIELESKSKETESLLNKKIMEMRFQLEDSTKNIRDLEQTLESKCKVWNRKEDIFRNFINTELLVVQELRKASKSLKKEVMQTQMFWAELALTLKAVFNTKMSQIEAAKQEQQKSETTMDYDVKPVLDPEICSKVSEQHINQSLLSLLHDNKVQYLTDADSEERSSNVSDSSFSVGTETDGSLSSAMDNDLEINQQSGILKEKKSKFSSRIFKKFLKKTEDATSAKLKSSDTINSKSPKGGSSQATDSSTKASKIKK